MSSKASATLTWSTALAAEAAAAECPTTPADELLLLVAQVRDQNEAAARRLVDALYPTVIRIVRAHRPSRVTEEDVMQDVFMKMFTKLDQFRGESPFSHWVARIATTTCLDHLRREKARPEIRFSDLTPQEQVMLLEADGSTRDAEMPEPPPSEAAEAEGSHVVDTLLGHLNADQRTVVRLLDIDQKSVKEICNLTGFSASKVKVTAHRARKKLHDVLQRLGQAFSL